jgi:hypothetical protein
VTFKDLKAYFSWGYDVARIATANDLPGPIGIYKDEASSLHKVYNTL